MIPISLESGQSDDWRALQRRALRSPAALLAALGLENDPLAETLDPASPFPLRVPPPFLAAMTPGDPNDPVLRQVLSLTAERAAVPGFRTDPLEEADHSPTPGLLHKYAGRALLITTGACAVHCRYCFRRHFPYPDAHSQGAKLEAALAYLEKTPSVEEIILSGGDPLMLDDEKLAALLTRLEALPHLKRLRIHSRTPVVLPQRLTPVLVERLSASRLQPVLVVHVNHAQELRAGLPERVPALRAAGITVLNQAVLLAGVNDSLDALTALGDALFAAGILPYYLHLLDPVAGAAAFAVPRDQALALYRALCEARSGYLVPRLAEEIPGRGGKQSYAPTLGPSRIDATRLGEKVVVREA